MNELYINLGIGWLYFKTNATTISRAEQEFYDALYEAGINADNLYIKGMELRDENYNTIDEVLV